MNILYTSTTYPPCHGGAQALHHKLAQLLSRKHHIEVVSQWDVNRTDWLLGTTLKAPSGAKDYTMDGIPVHRLGIPLMQKMKILPAVMAYYPCMPLALPTIARTLEKQLSPYAEKAELIHNMRVGREGLSFASYYAARRRGIPFLLSTVHHSRWVGWRYKAYIELYRKADGIIALSEGEKNLLVELGVDPEKITITGSGPFLSPNADPDAFKRRHSINGPFVLFLAQHFHYKGYQQVLDAMPVVWRSFPDVHFVFMGNAVGHSEKAFSGYAGNPRVHRIVQVSTQDKTDAFAACSIFCMPSTQESFGIVYIEAWCFEKPVIGCDIPSVSSVIDDGVNGLLTAQTAGAVADRLTSLLGLPEKARQMGAAGHRKVHEQYNWDRIAARVESAYNKAMNV